MDSNYNRWIYILHGISEYDNIKDNELYYDKYNNVLYLKTGDGNDILISDEAILAHIQDMDNPHHVTKTDIGLSRIPNIDILSKDELNSHIEDFNNPHMVTSEQIGLDKVKNYSFATDENMKNKASDKYVSPYNAREEIDSRISEHLDENKVKVSATTNADNYLLSLRKRGTVIWTKGNLQIVEQGKYEYKIEANGYYTKSGMIVLDSDRNIHIDLEKSDEISLDRQKIDGEFGLCICIGNDGSVHIWGDDVYEGNSGYIDQEGSARHIYAYNGVYTLIYDDGSIYQWGSEINNYTFLRLIDKEIRYKSFAMNNRACVLLDIDGNVYCHGDDLFKNRAPSSKLSTIYANRNMFVGINEYDELVAWGEDYNNMLTGMPLGKFNHISLSNTDGVSISNGGNARIIGYGDIIKQKDISNEILDIIDIDGSSIVSIDRGGQVILNGKIKDIIGSDTIEGSFTNCKLIDSDTLVLFSKDKSIHVYPKSKSLLYTAKPTQKVF